MNEVGGVSEGAKERLANVAARHFRDKEIIFVSPRAAAASWLLDLLQPHGMDTRSWWWAAHRSCRPRIASSD
ncbi:hypothetical protein [Streptomyces sp. NPDC086989]|uniref:hypothetical protein n=1 Tax=Streptomyces sp. NPDC086989 TaxID=3365764 RepID=UPI0038267413